MITWFKSYYKIRKLFISDISLKYQKEYKINIHNWLHNPYYTLKYKFICELASIISFLIFKTKITPNFITLINLLFALAAMLIFLFNFEQLIILGIFIFFSKQVLDNIDGFIARKKKMVSNYGKELDEICGHTYYYAILISLISHNYYLSENIITLFFGGLIIFFDLANVIFKKNFKILQKKNKTDFIGKNINFFNFFNFDGRTLKTDFLLLIIIIELNLNLFTISTLLIYIFLINKFLRNFYRLAAIIYARNK